MARVGSIDLKLIRVRNEVFVSIPRYVPHQELVTFQDLFIADLTIFVRGTSHIGNRRLPTNNFRNHIRCEPMVGPEFLVLDRIFVKGQHSTRNGVSSGVIATDDQQQKIAEKLVRLHVSGSFTISKH